MFHQESMEHAAVSLGHSIPWQCTSAASGDTRSIKQMSEGASSGQQPLLNIDNLQWRRSDGVQSQSARPHLNNLFIVFASQEMEETWTHAKRSSGLKINVCVCVIKVVQLKLVILNHQTMWHNCINRMWTMNAWHWNSPWSAFLKLCVQEQTRQNTSWVIWTVHIWGREQPQYAAVYLTEVAHYLAETSPPRLQFRLSKQFVDENPVCLWTAGCDTRNIFYRKD